MGATIIGVGRLGKDPEMKYTPKGTAQTYFTVAVDSGYGDKKETTWIGLTAWGNQAELYNQWLKKGSRIKFTAELSNVKAYQKQSGELGVGVYAKVYEIEFIDGVEKKEESDPYTNEPEDF